MLQPTICDNLHLMQNKNSSEVTCGYNIDSKNVGVLEILSELVPTKIAVVY